jgi:integrase/recombinase XerC
MPHEPPVDTSSLPRVHEDGSLLGQSLGAFLRALEGKNRSSATIRAYRSDVSQFLTWLHENNALARTPGNVAKADVGEYLAELAQQEVSGVSRARKLAALREYFRFLVGTDVLARSPIEGFETPKKEKNGRVFLRTEEYTRMLSAAGGNPRDYAMLQVFLQTGLRVSELCNLRLDDVDFGGRTLRITAGKGMVAREVELEKKGILAIKSYLAVRPQVLDDRLFLNRDGEPIGERGVRKLVVKYRDKAGITKKASCHSLRHTFATYKAEKGVSPFQLQQWLGHASLNTTQIYVHLGRQNAKKVMEATSL